MPKLFKGNITDIDPVLLDIIERYGKNLFETAKENLISCGAFASGRLLNSIRFDTDIIDDTFIVRVYMQDYGENVDEGSPPHWLPYDPTIKTFPSLYNPEGKMGWLQHKGLRLKDRPKSMTLDREMRSLAFLVARKISKKGTKATHFFADARKEHSIKKLNRALRDGLKQWVELEIKLLK